VKRGSLLRRLMRGVAACKRRRARVASAQPGTCKRWDRSDFRISGSSDAHVNDPPYSVDRTMVPETRLETRHLECRIWLILSIGTYSSFFLDLTSSDSMYIVIYIKFEYIHWNYFYWHLKSNVHIMYLLGK